MEDNIKKIPNHVGIIMDGNGRWAQMRNKPRSFGHKMGAKRVDEIVETAFSHGVKVLSLYTFSQENWARPKDEVDALMKLLKIYFEKFINKILKKKVRLLVSGDIDMLSIELKSIIEKDMQISKENNEFVLNLCINYGGRQEIVRAVNNLIEKNKKVCVESIKSELYTSSVDDPDLIIRTGGEKRLSNFLLFQSAYSELYFCDTLWPDFSSEEFVKALDDYALRHRRFGKL